MTTSGNSSPRRAFATVRATPVRSAEAAGTLTALAGFGNMTALTSSGVSRPFDVDRDGFVLLIPTTKGPTWDMIQDLQSRLGVEMKVTPRYGKDLKALDEALADVFSKVAIDPARVGVMGFSNGATYGLIALALVIIYKATTLINFAQGEMAMFGAFVVLVLATERGLPMWLAVVVGMLISAAAGAGSESPL